MKNVILTIPLPMGLWPNQLYWGSTKLNNVAIKDTYKLIKQPLQHMNYSCTLFGNWKYLWSQNILVESSKTKTSMQGTFM